MAFALSLHTTTQNLGIAITEINIARAEMLRDRIDLEAMEAAKSNRTGLPQNLPDNCQMLRDRDWLLGRELSSRIHICLVEAMGDIDWSELVFIAVASGVGSFTGTRIGVVLARTLGQQLNIPVYAIDCDRIVAYAQTINPPLSLGRSLLELACKQYGDRIYPDWWQALPIYDGSPV